MRVQGSGFRGTGSRISTLSIMSIFSKSRSPSRSGLTLVEVLFVMVILAILVGLVIGLGRYSDSAARIHQARADLGEWSSALSRWQDAFGEYPVSIDGTVLGLVSNTVTLTRFYTEEGDNELDMAAFFRDIALKDPWQQYYLYQGESNALSGVVFRYDLFSAGPDGITETSHDNVYFAN